MLLLLATLTLARSEVIVEAVPADPLLMKFQTSYMLPYLRRLKPTDRVHLGIVGKTSYLVAQIPQHKGTVLTRTRSTMTATMPVAEVLALASRPEVFKIFQGYLPESGVTRITEEPGDPLTLERTKTPLANRPYAVKSWPLSDLRKEAGLTGKGVMLGVIEDCVPDFRHPDFQTDDGATRFDRFWNQWSKEGPSPKGLAYGKEYTPAAINSLLRAKSFDGFVYGASADHMTAACGVAAGNGAASGKYCGVAPEASLVAVGSYLTGPNIVDSARYIFNQADRRGMPCVISISMSSSHLQGLVEDGSNIDAIALSEMVQEKRGRAIVSGAGNQASSSLHAHVSLGSKREADYLLVLRPGSARYPHSIAFEPKAKPEVRLELVSVTDSGIEPLMASRWLALADLSSPVNLPFLENGSGVSVDIVPKWHIKGLREFGFDIVPRNLAGKRTLGIRMHYRGTGELDAQSHSYLEHVATIAGDPDYVGPDNLQSVDSPANGEFVFAAGAFSDGRRSVGKETHDDEPGFVVSYTQPGGPLFDTYKPLILAPSHVAAPIAIDSKVNQDKNEALEGSHHIFTGTSAASPVLAGAIALYFQLHPTASHREVQQAIRRAAFGDSQTGPVPNPKSGLGKVDLRKFLR